MTLVPSGELYFKIEVAGWGLGYFLRLTSLRMWVMMGRFYL